MGIFRGSHKNGVEIYPGSKILYNVATGNGGAIWMNSAASCECKESLGVVIKQASQEDETIGLPPALIEGNRATQGGAIYIYAGKTGENIQTLDFVMEDGLIRDNHAQNEDETVGLGGGVYVSGGNMTVKNGTIENNDAVQNGGFAYLTGGTLNVKGGTLTGNTATINGGVAYLGGGTMNVSGGTITKNKAVDGGAFYLQDGEMNITGGEIASNTASQNGGAVYLGGGTLTVDDGTLQNNTSIDGGVAYLTSGTMIVNGGTITSNTANQNGGVVCIGGDGTMNISDGTITKNKAVDGGAFYLQDGEMNITGGEIASNTASQNGGAAYLGGGSLTVDGGKIYKNGAVNGGGFYLSDGSLDVNGGEISENTASDSGGGAFVVGGDVTVSGGTIVKNTAANVGGGIAINNGNYKMTGGSVDGNIATNGKGGGIHIASSGSAVTVEVLSGSIVNNKSGADGGAIAVVGVKDAEQEIKVTVGVNKFHEYTRDEDTGAITSDIKCDHNGDGVVESNACPVIEGNTSANSGGGIFISGGSKTRLLIYCLLENANQAGDGTSNSNFMMVEGGQIVVSTLNPDIQGVETDEDYQYGYVNMQSSIHVESGFVDVWGSMSNPLIESDITIDVINKDEGGFDDNRKADRFVFRVQYYENFNETGRYKMFSVRRGESITISRVMYAHTGYDIIGWNTEADGSGITYKVDASYTFGDGEGQISTSLVVYAIWDPLGYFVIFDPNVPSGVTVEGTMADQALLYDKKTALNLNKFIYKGYRFVGWVDSRTNTVYADGADVLNLTQTKGAEIVFKAQWKICNHTHFSDENYTHFSDENYIFTKEGKGGVLERMCPCHGYTETATLTVPEGSVYNGSPYQATYVVKYVSLNDILIDGANWQPTLAYSKNETPLGEGVYPTNAGTYTVSISYNGHTATLELYIDKAKQTSQPEKPVYKADQDAEDSKTNKIVIEDPKDSSQKQIEYQLRWYDGSELKTTDWIANSEQGRTFTLSTTYTNYFVFARYAEEDNYYPSDEVRADWVFYYTGNISIKLNFDEKMITCYVEKLDNESEHQAGVYIHVGAQSGYYLTSNFSVSVENGYDIRIDTIEERAKYHMYNFPTNVPSEGVIIEVTISGANVAVSYVTKISPDQVFGTVSGDSAAITRDSAFTAYFEISQYDSTIYQELQVKFGSQLPNGASVILLDKSDGSLWYTNIQTETDSIPLTSFVKMGDVENTGFTVSGNTLKYQLIVDFSHVADTALIEGETLQISLIATLNDSCVPEFAPTISVTLKDVPRFSVGATNGADVFEKNLEIAYATVESGVSTSKWSRRGGAIVLTSTGISLPTDVHIQVIEGNRSTVYYQNANGRFIIPLSAIGSSSINVKLISDAYPTNAVTYTLKAEIYAAPSNAARAPMNGEVIASYTLSYEKDSEVSPALKVTGAQKVVGFDQSLTVQVEYQLPTNARFRLSFGQGAERTVATATLQLSLTHLRRAVILIRSHPLKDFGKTITKITAIV